jgi:hypothetical protein
LSDELENLAKRWRPYAALSWAPENAWQELEVVRRFAQSTSQERRSTFSDLRKYYHPSGVDLPPDVIGVDEDGKLVAFEVTELVDQAAIEVNARRRRDSGNIPALSREDGDVVRNWLPVRSEWNEDRLLSALEDIIRNKDRKLAKVPLVEYERVILLVHTDEPDLGPDEYLEVVRAHRFSRPLNIHEAYLVFSYRPARNGYPTIEMQFD